MISCVECRIRGILRKVVGSFGTQGLQQVWVCFTHSSNSDLPLVVDVEMGVDRLNMSCLGLEAVNRSGLVS